MNRATAIETRLRDALAPLHLEITDESGMHNVPEGSQSHYRLVIVSDHFVERSLVDRHRQVNGLLRDEFANGLHALALHTLTPQEWFDKGGDAPASPECLGGGKSD